MLRTFLDDIPGIEIWDGTGHLPYGEMAVKCIFSRKPIPPAFVFVRDPWERQVSQWRWLRHIGQYGMGGIPFNDYLALVNRIVESGYATSMGPMTLNLAPIQQIWDYMGADHAKFVGRFENLKEDVVRILLALVGDLVDEKWICRKIDVAGHTREAPWPNGTHDYRELYTEKTARLIGEWNANLIERFGYAF